MATLLVDSPPACPEEQKSADGSTGAASQPPAGSVPPLAPPQRTCIGCGAAMDVSQDWCLQCGAGAPGAIGTPSWRSAGAILGVTAILALGAAAAGYAALSKGRPAARTVTSTVAQTATPAPLTSGTTTAKAPGTPSTIKPTVPLGAVKPPKIPLTATTPKTATTTTTTSTGASEAATNTSTTTTPSSSTAGGTGATGESQPAAILLDTNAATTYNPYNYPVSDFGDPSLTIDGEPSTAWTALVDPATAPKMAVGVLIDLKAKQKLSAVALITSTPGMTVQVYGANVHTAPASITDPAWIALSRSRVLNKKHVRITLRDSSKAFTFVTLWISKAPAASVGTPEAPGHVSVNEIELFGAG